MNKKDYLVLYSKDGVFFSPLVVEKTLKDAEGFVLSCLNKREIGTKYLIQERTYRGKAICSILDIKKWRD